MNPDSIVMIGISKTCNIQRNQQKMYNEIAFEFGKSNTFKT